MRPLNAIRFAPLWELRVRVPATWWCARRIAIFTRAAFDRVRRKVVPRRVEKRCRVRLAEVITGAASWGVTGGPPLGGVGVLGVGGGGAGAGAGAAGASNSNAPMSGVAVPSPLPS